MNNSGSFGDKIAKKFNIGDLVSWVDWKTDENQHLKRETYTGLLVNIIRKQLGERDVTFACVLPVNSNKIIELNILKIRKM